MRTIAFARRNLKEMLRDPLTLVFGAGFPLVILLLLSLIRMNIPVDMFAPETLAPGVTVFGHSFLALFAAMLVSKDRESALMMRLRISPMGSADFILGYVLPLLPLAIAQGCLCFLTAMLLGLRADWNVLLCLAAQLPAAVFHISLGLICGCLLNEKQVGGICGGLLTNVGAWLSGTWFDIAMLGRAMEAVARALPFANAVELGRAALAGHLDARALAIVCAYAAGSCILAVVIFGKKVQSA